MRVVAETMPFLARDRASISYPGATQTNSQISCAATTDGPAPLVFASILVLCLALPSGCGLDVMYTGLGERSTAVHDEECKPVCNCESEHPATGVLEIDHLEGRLYRCTSMVLTAPIGAPMDAMLNDYFAEEIGKEALNILFKVTRQTGRELLVDIGGGVVKDGQYQIDEEASSLICELTGATFKTTSAALMEFPVAEGLLDPPVLPLRDLRLGGQFDRQGGQITHGTLNGALTLEDAKSIQFFGADMASFLAAIGVTPDLDLDGDSTADACKFVGNFEAVLVSERQDH